MRNSETILVKFDEILYEVLLAVVKFDEIRLNIENKNETMQKEAWQASRRPNKWSKTRNNFKKPAWN